MQKTGMGVNVLHPPPFFCLVNHLVTKLEQVYGFSRGSCLAQHRHFLCELCLGSVNPKPIVIKISSNQSLFAELFIILWSSALPPDSTSSRDRVTQNTESHCTAGLNPHQVIFCPHLKFCVPSFHVTFLTACLPSVRTQWLPIISKVRWHYFLLPVTWSTTLYHLQRQDGDTSNWSCFLPNHEVGIQFLHTGHVA